MPNVVAILCADIHLSEKAPLARKGEPGWFAAMARPLEEIGKLSAKYNCPVICAGDVFDKPCPSSNLLNFAIANFPNMYAIPGQHDLPYHDYGRLDESGFFTLMQAELIEELHNCGTAIYTDNGIIEAVGFHWGSPLQRQENPVDPCNLQIAVLHAYCWEKGFSFPGADKKFHASSHAKKLQEFAIVVTGDNHTPFERKYGDTTVFNCGSIMRRTIDQKNHRPSVGLLYDDRTIERHYLDTSKDVFEERTENLVEDLKDNAKIKDFLQELQGLQTEGLDFVQAVKNYAEAEERKERRDLLLEIVGVSN